jgi:hypothetical protein
MPCALAPPRKTIFDLDPDDRPAFATDLEAESKKAWLSRSMSMSRMDRPFESDQKRASSDAIYAFDNCTVDKYRPSFTTSEFLAASTHLRLAWWRYRCRCWIIVVMVSLQTRCQQ